MMRPYGRLPDGRIVHAITLGRFNKVIWRVIDFQPAQSRLTLACHSPAREEGYPGNLDVTVTFTAEERALNPRFEAQCDAARPHAQLQIAGGYDHCRVRDENADCSAELHSPHSDITMRITSTHPAIQFYGGHGLARFHPHAGSGICLEPQAYPNAINEPRFPRAILRPGTPHESVIRYEFGTPLTGSKTE